MSNALLSAAYAIEGMPPVPKTVLASLADQANDHGQCWPSVAHTCRRTGWGRTAVIEAIAYLELAGLLVANKAAGRASEYRIQIVEPVRLPDQSATRTGPPRGHTSPPRVPVPVRHAAKPVRHADPNHQEPSDNPKKSNPQRPLVAELPDWLPAEAWADWCAHRKAIKAPMTPKAAELSIKSLAKLRAEGHEPVAMIELAIERGWRGLFAPASRAPPVKPSVAASFAETHYEGTPDDSLPAFMR